MHAQRAFASSLTPTATPSGRLAVLVASASILA